MIEAAKMRIGEVAAQAAVNVQTLRYYERVGLLPRPVRETSGYRSEKVHDLERMRTALSHYVTACRTRERLSECVASGRVGQGDLTRNDQGPDLPACPCAKS